MDQGWNEAEIGISMNEDGSCSARPGTPREALLVLVGINAGNKQRRSVLDFLANNSSFQVLVPKIPYRGSLDQAARWLEHYLETELAPRNVRAVHVLNYIGGGYVFRVLGSRLSRFSIGRVVHVRSPYQEQVPRYLVKRFTKPGAMLLSGRTVVEFSQKTIDEFPLPCAGNEQGLIVETRPSVLARWLGIHSERVPASAWTHAALLPGAADAIDLPVSHDEVYGPGELLRQFLNFVVHGRFSKQAKDLPQGGGEVNPD